MGKRQREGWVKGEGGIGEGQKEGWVKGQGRDGQRAEGEMGKGESALTGITGNFRSVPLNGVAAALPPETFFIVGRSRVITLARLRTKV